MISYQKIEYVTRTIRHRIAVVTTTEGAYVHASDLLGVILARPDEWPRLLTRLPCPSERRLLVFANGIEGPMLYGLTRRGLQHLVYSRTMKKQQRFRSWIWFYLIPQLDALNDRLQAQMFSVVCGGADGLS